MHAVWHMQNFDDSSLKQDVVGLNIRSRWCMFAMTAIAQLNGTPLQKSISQCAYRFIIPLFVDNGTEPMVKSIFI